MVLTETPLKRGKGPACKRCHDTKRKCVYQEGNYCVSCLEAGAACTFEPKKIPPKIGKRRNEGIENASDSDSFLTKREASSATVSHQKVDTLIDQNAGDQSNLYKPSQPPTQKKRRAGNWFCVICQSNSMASMLQCEIPTCKSWCHISCVYKPENRKHMLFTAPTGPKDSWIICPSCTECASTMERLKWRISSEENRWPAPCIQMDFPSQTIEDQANVLPQENEFTDLREELALNFELTREDKFQGFDRDKVRDLISRLDQSIYDYIKEIEETIERFNDSDDTRVKKPLAKWKLVDRGESYVTGQPWYSLDYPAKIQPRKHLPITAALRSILNTPDDKRLEIGSNLSNFSFSQVHTGLVGWFVIDVLSNELDIYKLPSMQPMRAMMSAVKDFANARWRGKGQHALREVHIRTWYKEPFQKAILLDEGNLSRRMEAYLQPLTRDFEKISHWSHKVANIIENTLKLWSYLQSLHVKVERIRPVIGEAFNSGEQEPFDENGMQQHLDNNVENEILWVLRPGIRLIEDGLEGNRSFTVKARVVL